jgi:mono/diheme cytochrome c family protein
MGRFRVRSFLMGIAFTLLIAAALGLGALYSGYIPAAADNKPSKFERWAARTSLREAVQRDTRHTTVPPAPDTKELLLAVKLYGANCAVCHGAADGKPSRIAKGFYIRSPQLGEHGVEDDPVTETYWKVKHGIRFTGMPAFGGTLSDDDVWALAGFLKTMDKLPPAVDAAWQKMPSAAAP